MIGFIFHWIICVLSRGVEYNYLRKVLEKRGKLYFGILTVLVIGSVQTAVNSLNDSTLNLVSYCILTLLMILVIFKTTWRELLINYAFILLFAMGSEFIVGMVYFNMSRTTSGMAESIWVDMSSLIIRFLGFVVLEKNKTIHKVDQNNITLLEIAYPLMTVLLLFKIYQVIANSGGESYGAEFVCLFLVVASIFSSVFIEKTIDLIKKNEKYQKTAELNMLNIERYKELEREEKVWKQREHDLIKSLSAIGGLAQEEKNEEILSVLEGMRLKLNEIGTEDYINNSVINALLKVKISEAERLGIDIDFYAEPNIDFRGYEIGDIISLVGNQIENAIEASILCCGRKKILVRYYRAENGQLVLEMENYYSIVPQKNGEIYCTNKNDDNRHGMGITIMREVAESYGGFLETEIKRNIFKSVVILPREQFGKKEEQER